MEYTLFSIQLDSNRSHTFILGLGFKQSQFRTQRLVFSTQHILF